MDMAMKRASAFLAAMMVCAVCSSAYALYSVSNSAGRDRAPRDARLTQHVVLRVDDEQRGIGPAELHRDAPRDCGRSRSLERSSSATSGGSLVCSAALGLLDEISRPQPPTFRHLRDGQQPRDFVVVSCVDAKHVADRETVTRPLDDLDFVTRADAPF